MTVPCCLGARYDFAVERPLRLTFQADPGRIARLDEEGAFKNLAVSKKKDPAANAAEEAEGRTKQEAIRRMLGTLPGIVFKDRESFLKALKAAAGTADLTLPAPIQKAILTALSERDETAETCRDEVAD